MIIMIYNKRSNCDMYLHMYIEHTYSDSPKYSDTCHRKFVINVHIYYMHCTFETFWNFVSAVVRHNYRDYNSKIWNQSENIYVYVKVTRHSLETLNEKVL